MSTALVLAPPPRERLRELAPALIAAGGLLVAAAVVVIGPVPVLGGIVGLVIVAVMLVKVEWAVVLYAASEPFGDMLQSFVPGGTKALGGLLIGAWLFRLCIRTRPVDVRHPAMYAVAGIALAVLASLAWHPNMEGWRGAPSGQTVAIRYLSYLVILTIIIDALRSSLRPRVVITAYTVSCGLASFVGLVPWLTGATTRASGPIADPNDFSFFLVGAVPLAAWLFQEGLQRGGFAQVAWRGLLGLMTITMVLTSMLTLSRGAILGLLAMAVVALLTGWLRMKWVLVGSGFLAGVVGLVCLFAWHLVQYALLTKEAVASGNVDSRFLTWTLAGEMIHDHPLLGVGPAGFSANIEQYLHGRVLFPAHIQLVHQMLLDVGAETGLVGLACFLGYQVLGARALYRVAWAASTPPELHRLAVAVLTAYVGTFTAAMFLTEQYYLPVWFFPAIGIALDVRRRQKEL